MKIRNQPSSPIKPLAIIGVAVILALLGWLYYAHHYQKWPFLPQVATEEPANTVDPTKPSHSQTKVGNNLKEQIAEQAKNESSTSPSSSTPNAASSVTMDITATSKTTSTLMIRTLIQKVTSTGTCSLSMAGPSGATYSSAAGVQAMASASTCQGFNVPLGSLSPGSWTITINFKDSSDTAIASKEVTI